jgi:hypothetical protein
MAHVKTITCGFADFFGFFQKKKGMSTVTPGGWPVNQTSWKDAATESPATLRGSVYAALTSLCGSLNC